MTSANQMPPHSGTYNCAVPRWKSFGNNMTNASQIKTEIAFASRSRWKKELLKHRLSSRCTICQKCFNEIPGETVTLDDDPTQPQTVIKKEEFQELKNNHVEPFITCSDCTRKVHQVCVLHMDTKYKYTCDNCLNKN